MPVITAEEIQSEFSRKLAAHRNNPTISNTYRQQLIAATYIAAIDQLDRLRTGQAQTTNDRIAALTRTLLGVNSSDPSAVISYRDANDRAAALDDETAALTLLRRTLQTGDETLSRAILTAGYENQWADIINVYATANPTLQTRLDELWQLRQDQTGSHGIKVRLATAATYYLAVPTELAGLDQYKIRDLANRTNPVT